MIISTTAHDGEIDPLQSLPPAEVAMINTKSQMKKSSTMHFTGKKDDSELNGNNIKYDSYDIQSNNNLKKETHAVDINGNGHLGLSKNPSNETSSNNNTSTETSESSNIHHRTSKVSSRSSVNDSVRNIAGSSTIQYVDNSTTIDGDALNRNSTLDGTSTIQRPTISTIDASGGPASVHVTTTGAERYSHRPSIAHKGGFPKSNSFQKSSRRRSKVSPDDRIVIPPGERITEGHVNYVMAYNMITGIRTAVSRCSKQASPIKEDDYYKVQKLIFDFDGSQNTPSTKYEFKFKDYAPEVFRRLRSIFHLDPADYLVSLTAKFSLTGLGSPGKSGSFFYYSSDYRFIIKTIHHNEHRQLRRILKAYYEYVEDNPDTFLCQFYGLHRIKMFKGGKVHKMYFIVMNNLFPPHKEMHKRFDLKGSTLGRMTDVAMAKKLGKTMICCKDLNWIKDNEKIFLGPIKKKVIMNQLSKDIHLLQTLNIMDYSLLIGIHDVTKAEAEDPDHVLDNFQPVAYREGSSLEQSQPRAASAVFVEANGGIHATNLENEELPIVYFLGVIDCLTRYSTFKRLETLVRSFGHRREAISAIPPFEYGARFLKFIDNSIPEPKKP